MYLWEEWFNLAKQGVFTLQTCKDCSIQQFYPRSFCVECNEDNLELKKIVNSTKKILKNAICLGGSSIRDFSSSNGKKGSFQQHFNVYGKKGELCSVVTCKNKIMKSSISNRATFFCSKCQK